MAITHPSFGTLADDRIIIFDTTLRDGEQSPGFSMNLEEKLRMAEALWELGIDVMEAGFPIASPGDFESVLSIAKHFAKDGPVVCGLSRTAPADILRAAEAVKPAARKRIHTFVSTSPLHMRVKLRLEPEQVLELVQGPPNNTVYFQKTVDRLVVAVTEPAPYAVHVETPTAPMVRSGSLGLRVRVERQGAFKGPVKLRMMWSPPGVGAQESITVAEGQSDAVYPLNATGDAALRSWTVALLAEADSDKGKVWTSSGPVPLEVAPPYLAMRIPMAAGEQGRPVGIPCKVDQLVPFEGEATVLMAGLPPKVTLEKNPLVITRDSKEVVFQAVVAADAPVGQHKGLFCQVTVPGKGGPILHSVGGGGVLRIDAPSKPKPVQSAEVAAATAPSKAAVTNPPVARPLSRLEKLRAEASGAGKEGK